MRLPTVALLLALLRGCAAVNKTPAIFRDSP